MIDRSQQPSQCARTTSGTVSRVERHRLAAALAAVAVVAAGSPARAADLSRDGRGQGPSPHPAAAAARPLDASGFSFDRTVLRSDLPVVVDFWAPWCIVCRELDAPLADLAAKFAGRARVVRVNVEWSSRVARRYGVEALPAILVFKGGQLVSRTTGGASEQDLEDLLADVLAPAPAPAPVAVAARAASK